MEKFKVAVVAGSESDKEYITIVEEELKKEGIPYKSFILSAHRSPEKTMEFAKNAEKEGFKIIIALAGYAAHLPGFIASFSELPVIGVPIPSSPLKGIDSLLSMVQMPKGVPVAVMSIGKAGAKNASILVKRIKEIFEN